MKTCTVLICNPNLIRTGKLLQSLHFESPWTALFFNHSPNTYIVTCSDVIFFIDANTQSMQPFDDTPPRASYSARALALSVDDAVLIAGSSFYYSYSVCGYDTSSLSRLWIHNTLSSVGAVCFIDNYVLATVWLKPTLILNLKTGAHVASLKKADGYISGLGVVEG